MKRLGFMVYSALALFGLAMVASPVAAGAYPSKPITLIVPFTPGSATDIIARVVGERMSLDLGQPVVVENRPGAGSTVGSRVVARADPDGYTLLANSNAHVTNISLYSHLPYDTLQDFVGITTLAYLPNVLITSAESGYQSVADLVKAAHAQPGALNFGSAGIGSATHINAEKFRAKANMDALHIPFSGTPQAVAQTVAGDVDFMFAPIVSALTQIENHRLRALAISGAKRSTALPDVPTTVQAGVTGSDFIFWVGLFAPSGTPADIVERLYESVKTAVLTPDVQEQLAALGAEAEVMEPEAFGRYVAQEAEGYAQVIKEAGLKLN